jgi:hypothetical protein
MRDTCRRKTTAPVLIAVVIALAAPRADADHERFLVGEMRNVDPSADTITSTSGACVPSHDRERLDCYFTSFALWKAQTEEQLKKQYEEAAQELNKDPAKTIQELRKGFCSDKRMTEPDPIRLKYSAWARAFHASVKAFCERPTRESALAFFRTMREADAKKCSFYQAQACLARAASSVIGGRRWRGRPTDGWRTPGRLGCAASSRSSRWYTTSRR